MKKFATCVAVGLMSLAIFCAAAAGQSPRGQMAVQDKLPPLPVGSISARGWLQRQMQEDSNGWVRITQQQSLEGCWIQQNDTMGCGGSKTPFYCPYIERQGAPIGGEYQAHWMDLVFRLGWVAGLEEYRGLGAKCVSDILASLDPDGYIGVDKPGDRFKATGTDGVYEMWGYGETLNALLCYHRFSGEERILQACIKSGDLLCQEFGPHSPGKKTFPPQAWFSSLTNAMVELYRQTGDKKYLEMADYTLRTFLQRKKWDTMLDEKKKLSGHAAGWGIVVLSMLDLYRAGGEVRVLEGLLHAHDSLVAHHLQPHGAPSGHAERLAGTGPYLNTELCDSFWWFWCWTEMLALTGEAKYADFAEKVALNALPGSRSKDGRVTAYFMCPNQLVARRASRTHYPARLYVECCQSNGPRTLPILVEHMVLATRDGGLAVPYYGSCKVRAQLNNGTRVVLTQETGYPFEETVCITVKTDPAPASFPLLLRVPGWCERAEIRINGTALRQEHQPGTWARLDRQWKTGDTVELTFPMTVRISFWQQQAAVVERGPLLYALPVEGNRKPLDKWGSFEQYARADSPWNYALVLDQKNPASSLQLKSLPAPTGGHVWEHPPLALEVDAVRVPGWEFQPGPKTKVVAPQFPKQPLEVAGTVEKVCLIPYGFTLLRMAYMPVVKPKKPEPKEEKN